MSFNSINNALQAFSKISLEEMNGVKLMDRVESKFILSAKQLPEILNQIKNDYRVVSILGNLTPSYKTVYFDTDSFYFYHEHHRGRKNRYKVRFRNYVESNLTFLEVKHKQNGRIDKQRIKVNNNNFILSPEDLMFLKEANIDQTELKQKLTNHYKRITLVSNHSVERVTFDIDVNFKYHEFNSGLKNVVIVELKQPTLSRTTPIYKVLKDAQIKSYNVSKYCIGLIKTHGIEKVKYNRFKKKIIQLNKINAL